MVWDGELITMFGDMRLFVILIAALEGMLWGNKKAVTKDAKQGMQVKRSVCIMSVQMIM